MRINELIVESQQIDELSLAGVGKGVGNVIRGTSTAVQGAKGAWQGAKDAWTQGKTSGTYDKARAAVSGIPANQAAPTGTQPVTQPASTAAAPTAASPAPAATPATAQGKVGVPVGRQAIDQAVAAVKSVRGDRRPQLVAYGMQQLGAIKESKVGIQSNFLGIEI